MKWPWSRKAETRVDPSWDYLKAPVSASGINVSAETAEGISACFACVQGIAETIASLPLILYRRQGDGDRERATDHPLYHLLHSRPNGYQTALEFREQLQASVLLRGNGYAEIEWDGAGNVAALHPIQPGRVTVLKLPNGRIAYDVADDNGRMRRLLQEEVLHLKDRSENGITGRSRIQIARDTLGLAIAQQDHGSKSFANGARLSGVLQTPHQMTAPQLQMLAESWRSQYGGPDNMGKTAVLENGLTYQQIGMSLEDAQWIAAQQFSVEQVARIFRVPPTMIGDLRHGNFSNSVEMSRVFVTMTLRRWLVMWEQAIEYALLPPMARKRLFAEHSVEGLLRGDATNRATFYESGIRAGWLLPSEARRLENLPTVEGLDDARQAANAPAVA